MGLKGDLKSFGLPELFQSLTINQHSGLLVIRSPLRSIGIFFTYGEISAVSLGTDRALRLGELLFREGKVSHSQLQDTLEEQKKMASKKRLGEMLISKGIITERELVEALTKKMEEEIYDVFFWEKAEFEFLRDVTLEKDIPSDFQESTPVNIDTPTLVIEAMHRLDTWEGFKHVISSFDDIFVIHNKKQEEIHKIRSKFYFDPLYLDGKHTLRDVSKKTPSTLYDVFKGVIDLYEKQLVRKISGDELVSLARERAGQKNYPSALAFYERIISLFPERADLKVEMARVLELSGDPGKSQFLWIEGGGLFLKSGEYQKAFLASKKIPEGSPYYGDAVKILFQSSVKMDQKETAMEVGSKGGKFFLAEKKFKEAREIYILLSSLCPEDRPTKEALAEAYMGENNKNQASKIYENLALAAEGIEDWKEALALYKKVLSIDPDKPFIETKIEALIQKMQKLKKKKKVFKMIVALAAGALVLLVLVLYFILQSFRESDGRQILNEITTLSQKMEQALGKGNFGEFKGKKLSEMQNKLSKLLADYSGTSAAKKAKALKGTLEGKIALFQTEYKKYMDKLQREEQAEAALQALKGEINRLLPRKKYQQIHRLAMKYIQDYPFPKWIEQVELPLLITTNPEGAEVRISTKKYSTPCVAMHNYQKKPLILKISRWGFEEKTFFFDPNKFNEISLDLIKTPILIYPPLPKGKDKGEEPWGPLENVPLQLNNMSFFISRDGAIHVLEITEYPSAIEAKEVEKIQISSPGDSFSPLFSLNLEQFLLGTGNKTLLVDLRARKVMDTFPSSKKKDSSVPSHLYKTFRFSVRPSPLGQGSRRFCLSNENKHLYFLRAREGDLSYLTSYETLEPVVGGAVFSKDYLFFGTLGGRVYALDVAKFPPQPLWVQLLEGEIRTTPLLYGNYLLVGTSRGELVLMERFTGKTLWTNKDKLIAGGITLPFLQDERNFFLPTPGGEILEGTLDNPPQWKALSENFGKITTPLMRRGQYLYFGGEKDSKYYLYQYDVIKKKLFWKYPFPGAIKTPPLLTKKYLIVSCSDGRAYFFLQ